MPLDEHILPAVPERAGDVLADFASGMKTSRIVTPLSNAASIVSFTCP
jgi:hypothetical protein